MGHIQSTYSYESKKQAFEKMVDQLDYLDVFIFCTKLRYSHRYFIYEKPNNRKYLRVREEVDICGNTYFKCYLH